MSVPKRLKLLSHGAWKVITSPKLIVALNVVGMSLQIIHQIEAFRRGERTIGFKADRDEG